MKEVYDLDLPNMPKYFADEDVIAAFFDTSLTTVGNWKRDTDFPKETKQGFLSSDVLTVYMKKRKADNRNQPDSGPGTLKDKKLEKEIEILQLRIDQIKGEWIKVEDHMQEMMAMATLLKHGFTNLPNILISKGFDAEMVKEVKSECNAMLEKIRSDLVNDELE